MRSIGAKGITINRLRMVQGHVDALRRASPEIRKWRRRAAALGPQRDLELGAGRRVRPGSRSHSKASTIGKKCDLLLLYIYATGFNIISIDSRDVR